MSAVDSASAHVSASGSSGPRPTASHAEGVGDGRGRGDGRRVVGVIPRSLGGRAGEEATALPFAVAEAQLELLCDFVDHAQLEMIKFTRIHANG